MGYPGPAATTTTDGSENCETVANGRGDVLYNVRYKKQRICLGCCSVMNNEVGGVEPSVAQRPGGSLPF